MVDQKVDPKARHLAFEMAGQSVEMSVHPKADPMVDAKAVR
jgi:hypothetical protein